MIDEPRIIPECYADKALIEFLIEQNTNKENGCHAVVASILSDTFQDKLAIGIIDTDKRKPKRLFEFDDFIYEANDIVVRKRSDYNHYLIMIQPAVEKWLLNCAVLGGIDLTANALPHDLKSLKIITKKQSVVRNSIFEQLLMVLKDTAPMQALADQIKQIIKS